jgi:hypothetical protein
MPKTCVNHSLCLHITLTVASDRPIFMSGLDNIFEPTGCISSNCAWLNRAGCRTVSLY